MKNPVNPTPQHMAPRPQGIADGSEFFSIILKDISHFIFCSFSVKTQASILFDVRRSCILRPQQFQFGYRAIFILINVQSRVGPRVYGGKTLEQGLILDGTETDDPLTATLQSGSPNNKLNPIPRLEHRPQSHLSTFWKRRHPCWICRRVHHCFCVWQQPAILIPAGTLPPC